MSNRPAIDELFERRIAYPEVDAQERLARLVGLDDHKARLTKILGLLVNPSGLESWAKRHHPGANGVPQRRIKASPAGGSGGRCRRRQVRACGDYARLYRLTRARA